MSLRKPDEYLQRRSDSVGAKRGGGRGGHRNGARFEIVQQALSETFRHQRLLAAIRSGYLLFTFAIQKRLHSGQPHKHSDGPAQQLEPAELAVGACSTSFLG